MVRCCSSHGVGALFHNANWTDPIAANNFNIKIQEKSKQDTPHADHTGPQLPPLLRLNLLLAMPRLRPLHGDCKLSCFYNNYSAQCLLNLLLLQYGAVSIQCSLNTTLSQYNTPSIQHCVGTVLPQHATVSAKGCLNTRLYSIPTTLQSVVGLRDT